MAHPLLLISSRPEDIKFWGGIAAATSMGFVQFADPAKVGSHLQSQPESFVFWDANSPSQEIEKILMEFSRPSRVFAITNEPINRLVRDSRTVVFGHHVFRRYEHPAHFLYVRLMQAAISNDPAGIMRYFPEGTKHEKFSIRSSGEKRTALERIQGFLSAQNINSKLVNSGVDASDELLMNAIFDAPYSKDKGYYKRETDRASSFDLSSREQVQVDLAACKDFIGISVSDQFGSLHRDVIMEHLCQNYRDSRYVVPEQELNAGLGLHRINQLALALLFLSIPGKRTEVMVFFSNTRTYREFRLGFCFFSIFAEK